MSATKNIRPSYYMRRSFLSATLSIAAAGSASLLLSDDAVAANKPHNQNCVPTMAALILIRYPGWIRTAAITSRQVHNLEPSHIYHFKGRVARCADFVGMGTDNRGNRIAFGTPTTDYGFMKGEYFAGRAPQTGTFTHI